MEASVNEKCLSVREAAITLKLSTSGLYKLVESGQINHIRFGRQIRFLPDMIREFIDAHTVKKSER